MPFRRSARHVGGQDVVWDVGRTCGRSLDHVAGRQIVSQARKTLGKIGKRVVAKETPRIATEHQVVLSFNLQAVYGFFPL